MTFVAANPYPWPYDGDLRPESTALEAELCGHVAERLTKYKQPREVKFVSRIPRNPSGKILRRVLRAETENVAG